MAGRVLERGHRTHREPDEVEGPQAERVDEGLEVVDQPVVAESVGRVPAGPAVASRVGEMDEEGAREQRQLGGEVLASDRRRAVEHHHRRTGAQDVVADVEAVGPDRRHLSPPAFPRPLSSADRSMRRYRRRKYRSGETPALRRIASSSASTRPMKRSWSPAENVSTTVHSRVAMAPSRSGRPVAPGCQAAPQKSSRPGPDRGMGEAIGDRLLALAEHVDRVAPIRPDHRGDEAAPIERHHHQRRLERDRAQGVDGDALRLIVREGGHDRDTRGEAAHHLAKAGPLDWLHDRSLRVRGPSGPRAARAKVGGRGGTTDRRRPFRGRPTSRPGGRYNRGDDHASLGSRRARACRFRAAHPGGRRPPRRPADRRRALRVHARRGAPVRDPPDADRGADVRGGAASRSWRWTWRSSIRATPG